MGSVDMSAAASGNFSLPGVPSSIALTRTKVAVSYLLRATYLYLIRAAFRAATFVTRVERSWDLSHDSHITPKKTC